MLNVWRSSKSISLALHIPELLQVMNRLSELLHQEIERRSNQVKPEEVVADLQIMHTDFANNRFMLLPAGWRAGGTFSCAAHGGERRHHSWGCWSIHAA
jgi:hypothetical protein